jgi:hypothetical protein
MVVDVVDTMPVAEEAVEVAAHSAPVAMVILPLLVVQVVDH